MNDIDIRIEESFIKQAKRLHASYPVVDMHLDLAGEILLRHQMGEQNVLFERYLPSFDQAGIRLIASSIYVPTEDLDQAWTNVQMQIGLLKGEITACNAELAQQKAVAYRRVRLVRSGHDLTHLIRGQELGILLYMEGLDAIGKDVDKLNELFAQGVRGASLTWSRPNVLANGCCKASEYHQVQGGLSADGKRALKRLEDLSMFLDVSHLNDDGFEDVCRLAERPFAATHSNSRIVYDHYRNLTDEQLQCLAVEGGMTGLNGCQYLTGSTAGNHLEMLCRHVEHEVSQIGAGYVGFGFDLCDSYDEAKAELRGRKVLSKDDCLTGHAQIPLVTAAILQRGMMEENVIKIMGKNWLHYLKKVLPSNELS